MLMFNNELLSDVKFVVRQDGSKCKRRNSKEIPAHKFLLAISSPVFYAMFYGELAETKGSIDISDCEYESCYRRGTVLLFYFILFYFIFLYPDVSCQ